MNRFMIRNYELTYLVSPDFSEVELKNFCDKIDSLILEEAGILENQSNPIKWKLAYPIKKRLEAFLITTTFKVNAENLEKIEKKLKAEKEILRYIIITRKPQKLVKEKIILKRYKKISKPEKEITLAREYKTEKIPLKAELKEIDKKIEEILKE